MSGIMDDAVRATILRNFSAREGQLAALEIDDNKPWRLGEGVVIFPEGVCPFCSAAIRSNRIWHIKERALLGQWRLEVHEGQQGRLVREPPEHPHVQGTNVCLGNDRSMSTISALFLGINPNDTFWGRRDGNGNTARPIKDWLRKMFGHRCGQADDTSAPAICEVCNSAVFDGAEHTTDQCDQIPCVCGCSCSPYRGRGRTRACGCGCPGCRCDRLAAERAGRPVPVSVPQTCAHECCYDCCSQLSYCATEDVWCTNCQQRLDNCECCDSCGESQDNCSCTGEEDSED